LVGGADIEWRILAVFLDRLSRRAWNSSTVFGGVSFSSSKIFLL
jgi:hypothetical protein